MSDDFTADQNESHEFKETLVTRRLELDQYREESERRNKSNKSFVASLGEFLVDTKSTLLKKISDYDETESQRIQLGPLMPAGRVTLESFRSLAETFEQGCLTLMEEAGLHWKAKAAK